MGFGGGGPFGGGEIIGPLGPTFDGPPAGMPDFDTLRPGGGFGGAGTFNEDLIP